MTSAMTPPDHGHRRHHLRHPQPDGGHQKQTVRAQGLDPEPARAIPDEVAQGDVARKLPLFDILHQQEQAHEAPDALI